MSAVRMLGRVPVTSPLSRRVEEQGKAYRIFNAEGDFAALNEARAWLTARGFTVAKEHDGAPIGVMLGDVKVETWRNLDPEDIEDLHGQLWTSHGRYRVGPVFLDIRDDCPQSVFDALESEPHDVEARRHVEGRP